MNTVTISKQILNNKYVNWFGLYHMELVFWGMTSLFVLTMISYGSVTENMVSEGQITNNGILYFIVGVMTIICLCTAVLLGKLNTIIRLTK
jgi:hypothetical protein